MAVAISRNGTDPASVSSSGGVTSYTGVSIGTAAAGRWVYVGVTAETTGAADPTSATMLTATILPTPRKACSA